MHNLSLPHEIFQLPSPEFLTYIDSEFEDRIVRRAEVLKITGLSEGTMFRLMRNGSFPKSFELSENTKGWWLSRVLIWLHEKTKTVN